MQSDGLFCHAVPAACLSSCHTPTPPPTVQAEALCCPRLSLVLVEQPAEAVAALAAAGKVEQAARAAGFYTRLVSDAASCCSSDCV